MSIYKEEKNKKDCFEHLISLQDCDHRFHANAECATREQDSKYKWNQRKKDVNIMKRLLRSLWQLSPVKHLVHTRQKRMFPYKGESHNEIIHL